MPDRRFLPRRSVLTDGISGLKNALSLADVPGTLIKERGLIYARVPYAVSGMFPPLMMAFHSPRGRGTSLCRSVRGGAEVKTGRAPISVVCFYARGRLLLDC